MRLGFVLAAALLAAGCAQTPPGTLSSDAPAPCPSWPVARVEARVFHAPTEPTALVLVAPPAYRAAISCAGPPSAQEVGLSPPGEGAAEIVAQPYGELRVLAGGGVVRLEAPFAPRENGTLLVDVGLGEESVTWNGTRILPTRVERWDDAATIADVSRADAAPLVAEAWETRVVVSTAWNRGLFVGVTILPHASEGADGGDLPLGGALTARVFAPNGTLVAEARAEGPSGSDDAALLPEPGEWVVRFEAEAPPEGVPLERQALVALRY